MTQIGSRYSSGRQKPLTVWQRFEAWRQVRRSQLATFQQRNLAFSQAVFGVARQVTETSSINAAEAALDRIMARNAGTGQDAIGAAQLKIRQILDRTA